MKSRININYFIGLNLHAIYISTKGQYGIL